MPWCLIPIRPSRVSGNVFFLFIVIFQFIHLFDGSDYSKPSSVSLSLTSCSFSIILSSRPQLFKKINQPINQSKRKFLNVLNVFASPDTQQYLHPLLPPFHPCPASRCASPHLVTQLQGSRCILFIFFRSRLTISALFLFFTTMISRHKTIQYPSLAQSIFLYLYLYKLSCTSCL